MRNEKTISGNRFVSACLNGAQFSTTQALRLLLGLALLGGMLAVAMQADRTAPLHAQASGCTLNLSQQRVHIEPGQGIETGGRWAQCEFYDGHPVVVYSNLDQQLAKRGG